MAHLLHQQHSQNTNTHSSTASSSSSSSASADVKIKEGYLELQTGSGIRRKFHRRYCVVKKSGIVDLFEKREKQPKESFHVQGGEEIILANVYKKRFRLKIIIPEFKKAQKWCFGFESEASQKAWYSAFDSILKQMVLLPFCLCLSLSSSHNIDTHSHCRIHYRVSITF